MMRHDAFQTAMCGAMRRHLADGGKPVVPAGGNDLWSWFLDLSGRRSWHASGPNPIGFEVVAAYAGLFRLPITDRHVRVLMAMDAVFIDTFHARRKADADTAVVRPTASMTASIFDAMFG